MSQQQSQKWVDILKKRPFPTQQIRTRIYDEPFGPDGMDVSISFLRQGVANILISKEECLNLTFHREEKKLVINFILYYRNAKQQCFQRKKIYFPQIIEFIKKLADDLDCKHISLQDVSFIPVQHPTLSSQKSGDEIISYKFLSLLSSGQTIYMKQGFFYLPFYFVEENFEPKLNEFPSLRDLILQNLLVINKAFSKTVLRCAKKVRLQHILPPPIPIPDFLPISQSSSLNEVATCLIKSFRNEKNTDKLDSLITFYRQMKEGLSSDYYPDDINIFINSISPYIEYEQNQHQNQDIPTLKFKQRIISSEEHCLLALKNLLFEFSNDSHMFKLENGSWTHFTLGSQKQIISRHPSFGITGAKRGQQAAGGGRGQSSKQQQAVGGGRGQPSKQQQAAGGGARQLSKRNGKKYSTNQGDI